MGPEQDGDRPVYSAAEDVELVAPIEAKISPLNRRRMVVLNRLRSNDPTFDPDQFLDDALTEAFDRQPDIRDIMQLSLMEQNFGDKPPHWMDIW